MYGSNCYREDIQIVEKVLKLKDTQIVQKLPDRPEIYLEIIRPKQETMKCLEKCKLDVQRW